MALQLVRIVKGNFIKLHLVFQIILRYIIYILYIYLLKKEINNMIHIINDKLLLN